MSTNQLTKAARQMNALVYKDGLVDLLLGAFFTLLALQEPLELNGWPVWLSYLPSIGAMAAGLVIYVMLKRRMTTPRIGVAKVSIRRNPARRNILLFAVALQLITLVIFLLASNGWLSKNMPSRPNWLIDAFFAVATFGFFAYLGFSASAPRFYLYGLALAAVMMIAPFTRGDSRLVAQLPIMIAGLVMVIGGIITLLSFLRDYPVVELEEAHE